jgi:hypothetical protein
LWLAPPILSRKPDSLLLTRLVKEHIDKIDFANGGPRNGEGESMFEVAQSRGKTKSMGCLRKLGFA